MVTKLMQPTAQVTPEDVERVLRRDFPGDAYAAAAAVLATYGTAASQRESPRVQLAVLKLANGDLDKLRLRVETARRDYRDVLSWAEYPAYGKFGFRTQRIPPEDLNRAIESDWQQYQDWLNRP